MRDQVRDEVERCFLNVLGDMQAKRLVAGQVEGSRLDLGELSEVEAIVDLSETRRVDLRPLEQGVAHDARALRGLDDRPDEQGRKTHGKTTTTIAQRGRLACRHDEASGDRYGKALATPARRPPM